MGKNNKNPVIGVIMGSKSDWEIMKNCCDTLKLLKIKFDARVISAHRTPKRLEKFINQYPDKLSGGMQRRIALARAFASNPSVLLLDEPFISLDKKIANLLRKLLINLWKKNKPTVIFVSHDLDEAIELADRIFFLSSLPSKILLEHKINLTRPRNINSKKFISLKRLLSSTTRTKSQKN